MKICITLALMAFLSTFADPSHAGLLWETRDKLKPEKPAAEAEPMPKLEQPRDKLKPTPMPLGCHYFCPPPPRYDREPSMPVDKGYMWLD